MALWHLHAVCVCVCVSVTSCSDSSGVFQFLHETGRMMFEREGGSKSTRNKLLITCIYKNREVCEQSFDSWDVSVGGGIHANATFLFHLSVVGRIKSPGVTRAEWAAAPTTPPDDSHSVLCVKCLYGRYNYVTVLLRYYRRYLDFDKGVLID